MRFSFVAITLLASFGCGDSAPPDVETELVLVTDAPGTDSSIYLTGELRTDALELDVWVRGETDVFGVSAHVMHEGELLGVDADAPLGDDTEARHLSVRAPGDVGVGGTRLSPELGEVSVNEPTHLASLRFAPPSMPTEFRVAAITVRRADGSFVPTTGFGAAIVEQEVE